jgi:hypothetical protein
MVMIKVPEKVWAWCQTIWIYGFDESNPTWRKKSVPYLPSEVSVFAAGMGKEKTGMTIYDLEFDDSRGNKI